jgi:ATP-dependent helicase HrpB
VLPAIDVAGANLPIRAVLDELIHQICSDGSAVLVAPPGTGKTTLAPLAVADAVTGTVLVAEPRRVAARAAAARMAALLGERVGEQVGYSVRGDSKRGPRTRIEVVTTGLLVRRMQHDPELAGVSAVIIDECHERQLDTDLAVAFGADLRAGIRPDIALLAMSATAQASRIAAALSTESVSAPVIEAADALHHVEVIWSQPTTPIDPPRGTRVDPRLLDHVSDTVRAALRESEGDVLVFLPGVYEIGVVASRLSNVGIAIHQLHGTIPAAQQDEVLRPSASRRIVLSTAIAESSLTVPGVRVVVDAGLSRVPRADLARGLGTLVTIKESKASAHQRAGRAGREGPGRVYRCWSQSDHQWLPDFPDPEIAGADLTAFALELACWGAPGGRGLALMDAPPPVALELAESTLRDLGAIDDAGRATARGRRLTEVGVHPRLARALLDSAEQIGAANAAEVVAMLSGDTRTRTDDLVAAWRELRNGTDRAATSHWREEVRRLARAIDQPQAGRSRDTQHTMDIAAGLVVGLAYPERIARRRREDGRTYLMAGGTGAELAPSTALNGVEWLAIAAADRAPGRRDASVRTAVAIDEDTARLAGVSLLREGDEVAWRDGDVRASTVVRLGAIVLTQRPARADSAGAEEAVREGLRREGLALLRWTSAATDLRRRLAACHLGLGEPWPDVSDEALLRGLDLSSARSRSDLTQIDVSAALRRLLPYSVAGQLDSVAPERIEVPSGSRIRIDYEDPGAPALPVKVQEVFGWAHSPVVAGQPLRLNLLSPAGRVVAITSDLRTFWANGYPSVRSELRGRYPRHPWPEDPASEPATKRVKPRAH